MPAPRRRSRRRSSSFRILAATVAASASPRTGGWAGRTTARPSWSLESPARWIARKPGSTSRKPKRARMSDERRRRGCLIVIGGGEDKKGDRVILREVAKHVRGGKLVIATVASHQPEGYF